MTPSMLCAFIGDMLQQQQQQASNKGTEKDGTVIQSSSLYAK